MKVLDLLDEIDEICETAKTMPLFNSNIVVSRVEMEDIVKDIRAVLPEEIQQAQFIKNERQRILDEAKKEYELLIHDAEKQAEILVDQHEITEQAKAKAREILASAESNAKYLKMSTFEYIDKILYDFQEKMDMLNGKYFGEMFEGLQQTFDAIGTKLQENRNEIKDLAYKTQVDEQ